MQERRNSSALAMELRISCTKLSICNLFSHYLWPCSAHTFTYQKIWHIFSHLNYGMLIVNISEKMDRIIRRLKNISPTSFPAWLQLYWLSAVSHFLSPWIHRPLLTCYPGSCPFWSQNGLKSGDPTIGFHLWYWALQVQMLYACLKLGCFIVWWWWSCCTNLDGYVHATCR